MHLPKHMQQGEHCWGWLSSHFLAHAFWSSECVPRWEQLLIITGCRAPSYQTLHLTGVYTMPFIYFWKANECLAQRVPTPSQALSSISTIMAFIPLIKNLGSSKNWCWVSLLVFYWERELSPVSLFSSSLRGLLGIPPSLQFPWHLSSYPLPCGPSQVCIFSSMRPILNGGQYEKLRKQVRQWPEHPRYWSWWTLTRN